MGYTRNALAHPDADELLVQYHPGEQIDAGNIGGKQSQCIRGEEHVQRQRIQIGGNQPQDAEREAAIEEATCKRARARASDV